MTLPLDLDELERIGTSALVHNRVPADLSSDRAINRWIFAARENWQAMIDEIRRLRYENERLDKALLSAAENAMPQYDVMAATLEDRVSDAMLPTLLDCCGILKEQKPSSG